VPKGGRTGRSGVGFVFTMELGRIGAFNTTRTAEHIGKNT